MEKEMNCIVIYATSEQIPHHRYQKLKYGREDKTVLLRCDLFNGFDVERALSRAQPFPGEIVLNSIEVP
jgi:hypothetical protein